MRSICCNSLPKRTVVNNKGLCLACGRESVFITNVLRQARSAKKISERKHNG